MGAYLRYEYKRGFLLTEEALVRIEDIIRTRVSDLGAADLKLGILRDDGLSLEYHKPTDFVQEYNLRPSRILEIVVLSDAENFKFQLHFPRSANAWVIMETESRDLAFLLSSDLKEYMASDVLRHRRWTSSSIPVGLAAVTAATASFIILLFTSLAVAGGDADVALGSNEIADKVDYLVRTSSVMSGLYFPWIIILSLAIGMLVVVVGGIERALYPRNVFYFGNEAQWFNRIKVVRDKLFWGVLIALGVGVFASYIASRSALS